MTTLAGSTEVQQFKVAKLGKSPNGQPSPAPRRTLSRKLEAAIQDVEGASVAPRGT